MSWLDDLFAPATQSLFLDVEVSQPRPMGMYAFDVGVEEQLERLVNQFASLLGYPKVVINGSLSAEDANRIVQIQRALYTDYTCDAAKREAGVAKLESQLDAAAVAARAEKGITVTPEQMWCSQNQTGITTKLPQIAAAISSGQLKRCSLSPNEKVAIGALALGVGILLLRRDR